MSWDEGINGIPYEAIEDYYEYKGKLLQKTVYIIGSQMITGYKKIKKSEPKVVYKL